MKTTKAHFAVAKAAASALLWAASSDGAQLVPGGMTIDRDDIAGVVTGARGTTSGRVGTGLSTRRSGMRVKTKCDLRLFARVARPMQENPGRAILSRRVERNSAERNSAMSALMR